MNTNCKFIRDNLFDIQDNLLPEAGMAMAREHLAGCPGCASMLSTISSVTGLIEEEKKATFNPFFGTRIMLKIDAHNAVNGHRGMPQFPRLLRPLMAAALIILAVLTGFFAGKQGRTLSRQASRSDMNIMKSELFISELNDEDKTIELYK